MDYPIELPKFNRYSFAVATNCTGKLLEHQESSLEALQDWFGEGQDPSRIAVVSMPTGSGKSGVICCLPYFLGRVGLNAPRPLTSFPDGKPRHSFDKPILVLSPNLDIAKQLEGQILIKEDKNEIFLFQRGIVPEQRLRDVLPNGVMIEGTHQLTQPDFLQAKDVIISNVQKFLSKKQLPTEASPWWVEELPDDLFSLIIVDEAHHFPAPTWSKIIDKFSRGHALVVFFSATPYKTSPTCTSKLESVVPGPFAYHLTLEVARGREIIRTTDFFQVEGGSSTLDEIFLPVLKEVKKRQDTKNRDHLLPGNVPHMAIAITKNIMEAEVAVQVWNRHVKDGSAFAYHSQLDKTELPKIMKRIKENQVELVVVVSKLMEGFDHPPISIAAILTGIKSPRKFVQFVGRAQRVVRFQGEKEPANILANIVTHICYRQSDNYEKFTNEVFVKL